MNQGARAPFSLFLSFFPLVCRPLNSPSFFLFYSMAHSLHGPIWASSNRPRWAYCVGLSPLFFGQHSNLIAYLSCRKIHTSLGLAHNLRRQKSDSASTIPRGSLSAPLGLDGTQIYSRIISKAGKVSTKVQGELFLFLMQYMSGNIRLHKYKFLSFSYM